MYQLELEYYMTERGIKIRDAFRKKYGVDHPSQLPSVKEKIRKKRDGGSYDEVAIKMKQTLKEKYGDANYVNVEKNKETKLRRYGDANYNNREKMINTNLSRYGHKVSPNTTNSTKERILKGEIGFNSKKYKEYLISNDIENVSQLESVKKKKKITQNARILDLLFNGDRLKSIVSPLFIQSEYDGNSYDKLYLFSCNTCKHEFKDTLYSGNIPRCLECNPHKKFHSKVEDDINQFLLDSGVVVKRHDRSILAGNEIDMLLPDLGLGIECNGIVWHSELFGNKSKTYHLDKTNIASEKNIKLLHVMDWEWLNKNAIIKSIISSYIGKSERIFARKCKIREIVDSDKSIFLEENHIQGNDKSSIRIGLFYNNTLVSVMTFGKSRFNKSYEYEMLRYCNKCNTTIVGGASRLFNYFIKTYNPKSIISYCDRRFFSGNVYLTCGMKLEGSSNPSYHYFHKNKCIPINRMNFQKHKLKKILSVYDPSLSEWENMQINGYDRIWDCGNLKFVWNF
jgi:hypothetical protein